MEIRYFCPVWGMKHLPLPVVLEKIKSAGYDGAEIALNPDTDNIKEVKRLFNSYELDFLVQHPYGKGNTAKDMLTDYLRKLAILTELSPLMVNCHTGKDHFTFGENMEFITAADELSRSSGILISHETHRGRFSFCTVLTRDYIEAFPDIHLTADFSHWCVVAESLLEDQSELVDLAIGRSVAIHARVGYAQGPQVPHPAAPEYKRELLQHLAWWKRIVSHNRNQGRKILPITCEFGPSPYLHTLPFTNQPVASQFELNLHMKNYLTTNLI